MFQPSKDVILAVSVPEASTSQAKGSYHYPSHRAWLKAGLVFATTTGAFMLAKTTGAWSWAGSLFSDEANTEDGLSSALPTKVAASDQMVTTQFPIERDTALVVGTPVSVPVLPFAGSAIGDLRLNKRTDLGAMQVISIEGIKAQITPAVDFKELVLPQAKAQYTRPQLRSQTNPEIGEEFRVNTYTVGKQHMPSIIALSGGKFVVAWQSNGQDGSDYGIYGQMYNTDGSKYGTEFRANTYITSTQSYQEAAGLSDGKFVVAWQSLGQDGSDYGIYAQMYNATGDRYGAEFKVNNYITNAQTVPTVAGLSAGKFVIAWRSEAQDGSSGGIYAQMYNASGDKCGDEFRVNTYTASSQGSPAISILSAERFVITWDSNGQDGSDYGVHAQIYNATGSKYGSEFKVNTYTLNAQHYAAVAAVGVDKFVIAWQSSGQDGSGYGVYAQMYYVNGTKYKTEFMVNTYVSGDQLYTAIATLGAEKFVVAWQSLGQDGSYEGVYAQIYNKDGNKYGSEFRVNTYTTLIQGSPSIAALSDTTFVITWDSDQDGDVYGIYAKIYSITPVVKINSLSISEGQTLTLTTSANLNAIDPFGATTSIMSLRFYVADVQHGNFKLNGVLASNFTLQNIIDAKVAFVHDGGELAPSYTLFVTYMFGGDSVLSPANITFFNVNDLPVVSAVLKNGFEDVTLAFIAADFTSKYSDAEGDALTKIQITSLPVYGALKLSGVAISLNQEILLANLKAITFVPNTDWSGQTIFTWKAYDGTDYSTSANVNITVVANEAPTISAVSKSGPEDAAIIFTAADFTNHFQDADVGDTLTKIKVLTLPANGVLRLNSVSVIVDQEILISDLGGLTFVPPIDWSGIVSFNWKGSDGKVYSETYNVVDITISQSLDATNIGQVINYIEDINYNLVPIAITTPCSTVSINLTLSDPTAGSFSVGTSGGVTSTYDAATGTWQASGKKENVNFLLASLVFMPAANAYKSFNIGVHIIDGYGQNLSSTIGATGSAVNDAPTIGTAINGQAGCCVTLGLGQPYNFTFAAKSFTDFDLIDGDTLIYTASKVDGSVLPSWLNFDSGTRTFYGIPTSLSDISSLALKVTAIDLQAASISQTFVLNIVKSLSATNLTQVINYIEDTDCNLANIAITTLAPTVTARLTLSDNSVGSFLEATSGGVSSTYDPMTGIWQAIGALHDVNILLADLIFRPAANVNKGFSVSISINDEYGQSLSSTVGAIGTAVNDAPVIGTAIIEQMGCCSTIGIGQAYSFVFASGSFIDVDAGDTLSYTATKDNGNILPSWLSFDAITRTFSGTPISIDQIGDLSIRVTAIDTGGATTSQSFSLTIEGSLSATNIAQVISYTEDSSCALADIVIFTFSPVVSVKLSLSDEQAGALSTATSGSVTSTYDSLAGTWQASGVKDDVNRLLAALVFKPTQGYHKDFSIAVNITDSYAQGLSSSISVIGIVKESKVGVGALIGGIVGGVAVAGAFVGAVATTIYKRSKKQKQQELGLIGLDSLEPRSWYFDLSLKPSSDTVKNYYLIDAGEADSRKVAEAYQRCPVPGMDLKSVRIVYSPNLEQGFEARVKMLQEKEGNFAFNPGWPQENNVALRGSIVERLHQMVAPYKDAKYGAVNLLLLWHGTNPEILDSIFKTGFASLSMTDEGFFGQGLYSTFEAEYAYKVYSKGALLVNWVSFYSAYPVIDGDMEKLRGKGHYSNYDAHFAPVIPASRHTDEQNFYPCKQLQDVVYHELVVFDTSQCIPRYLVELQPSLPAHLSLSSPRASIGDEAAVRQEQSTIQSGSGGGYKGDVHGKHMSLAQNPYGFFVNPIDAHPEDRFRNSKIIDAHPEDRFRNSKIMDTPPSFS